MNRNLFLYPVALSVLGFPVLQGCKDVTQTQRNEVITGKTSPEFYASSQQQLKENGKFFFSVYKKTFTTELDALPMQGSVEPAKQPSSGYWYPERQGGTNIVVSGNQTPLQKYDQAYNGSQPKAATWEQQKHSKNGSWYGHCNGYSAAAQRYPQEPNRNVVHNGVTFTPQDIKALMAEIHMSADFIFLGGGRCETNNLGNPNTRTDPTVMGICEDINPGTLHAAVTNWIGRQKHTIIMDSFAGEEVWNYPYYQYSVTRKEGISKSQAAQLVGNRSGNYIFNPSAVSFARIAIQITYANATQQEVLQAQDAKNIYLEYVLELDSQGRIIGGEWIGQSQRDHPDFLWVALPPLEPNGTEYMHNPHVKIDEVIKLWAKSTGNDPNNPPSDIVRPEIIETWGRYPEYDVVLDSSQRGAVFAGKPVVLEIKRKAEYRNPSVTVDVILDGKLIANLSDSDGKQTLNPGLGLHRLGLVWERSGQEIARESLKFHVVR